MVSTLSYIHIAIVLLAGQTLCQQAATYSSAASGQAQTTLEDIERDNLRNAAPSQAATPSAQPQYVPYQTPDQYSQYYKFAQQQQQALPYVPQGQQPYAAATPLYSMPSQQALYSAAGQQATYPAAGQQATYPAAGQQATAAAYSPNQQPLIFYTQTKHPTIDFAGVSLFPVGNPYGQNAAGSPYVQNAAGLQAATATAGGYAAPSAKAVPAQVPSAAAYALPPSAYQQQYPQQYPQQYLQQYPQQYPQQYQQQYYQPTAMSQAPNAQYLYNALYQLQSPQKSVYSAGIKSTTPAIPTKSARDDHFVPIGGGSSYYTSNSDPYTKSRTS